MRFLSFANHKQWQNMLFNGIQQTRHVLYFAFLKPGALASHQDASNFFSSGPQFTCFVSVVNIILGIWIIRVLNNQNSTVVHANNKKYYKINVQYMICIAAHLCN